jgi:hypothetical protein
MAAGRTGLVKLASRLRIRTERFTGRLLGFLRLAVSSAREHPTGTCAPSIGEF